MESTVERKLFAIYYLYYSLFEQNKCLIEKKSKDSIRELKDEIESFDIFTKEIILKERHVEMVKTYKWVNEIIRIRTNHLLQVETRLWKYKEKKPNLNNMKKTFDTMRKIRELERCVSIIKTPETITGNRLTFVKRVLYKLGI